MLDCIDPTVQPLFIGVQALPSWLERIRPHLARMAAGSGGRYLACDLTAMLVAGKVQLWLALDGPEIACVMITEIVSYPRCRELRCLGLVGHQFRRWAHLLGAIEIAAKQHFGCTKMAAVHPPRYRHILPGYRATHWLSEKDL